MAVVLFNQIKFIIEVLGDLYERRTINQGLFRTVCHRKRHLRESLARAASERQPVVRSQGPEEKIYPRKESIEAYNDLEGNPRTDRASLSRQDEDEFPGRKKTVLPT